jgi:protoporphyrinogen/coproporphyrinogen III oxidase
MNPETLDLAIVGGGLSGLTLASEFQRQCPDKRFAVLESSDRVGGAIHTESIDGYLIDHGADMFAIDPSAAIDLCRDLEIESKTIAPKVDHRGAMIVHQGKLQPIPQGFVLMRATQTWPMMTTPLLSPTEKLRFLRERWIPTRNDDSDESVADFTRRRMGSGVLDRIVAPLVAGIYTADIEQLSMRATMSPIWAMEKQHGSLANAARHRRSNDRDQAERHSAGARYGNFRSFNGGMIELIQWIQKSIDPSVIQTRWPASGLHRAGDLWRIESTNASSPDLLARQVVLATPPQITSQLLKTTDQSAAQELANISAASAAIVILGVPRNQISHPIDMFGFVVPPIERRKILAVSFASHKYDGRAPQDHVLIRVFIGGVLQSQLLDQDDSDLIAIALTELRSLIGLSGQPILTKVIRWNQAMPQYNVGHLDRVDRIEKAIKRHRGLHLLGNWKGGVGIAPVIASARLMAKQIATDVG